MKVRLVVAFVLALAACRAPEDPARAALRDRLRQPAAMSADEFGKVLDEVSRTIADKTVRIRQDNTARVLEGEQRDIVLGMLMYRAGVFDEGLQTDRGVTVRIFNAPGRSANAEIEATRRLLIDVDTFLPRRFEFSYAFPGFGDYAYDLVVDE